MKTVCALAIACLLLLPSDMFAQTRRRTTPRRRAPARTTQAQQPAAQPAELAAARQRVGEQIKILTRFLYVYARIANGVELAEQDARGGQVRPETAATIERNKTALRENLRNIRAGLEQLENQFNTPELQRRASWVSGIGRRAAEAEARAAANQFDQAGRILLEVVNQLTDALREMR